MQAETDLPSAKEQTMNICNERWFQIAEKCWRHFLGWGLAIPASAYAFRAVIGLPFDVGVFGALTFAAAAPYGARAIEKYKGKE